MTNEVDCLFMFIDYLDILSSEVCVCDTFSKIHITIVVYIC